MNPYIKPEPCANWKKEWKELVAPAYKDKRFVSIYNGMLTRCNAKKGKYFNKVRICRRWFRFSLFARDMYKRYLDHCKKHGIKDTTIDRINTLGDYATGNCRWATMKVQMNNRIDNII